ncbi:MAG: amino acid ABC transporter substrate-binding protein, partial [Desulfobacterales bacterium]|nr:amino acid ABC transporter substrate-binding protein [Desulfobacterales bacterium]
MIKKCKFALVISLLICCSSQPGYSTELKTSFQAGSYPRFYIEENGNKAIAGMCIDIMKAFEQKAPEIHFSYEALPLLTPLARIKHDLKHNTIQAAFGMARNRKREKIYQYTNTPLYPVKFVIFTLASDKKAREIKTFEDMQAHGGTVLGLRGTNAIKVFQEQTGHLNIPVEVVTRTEQNVKKLLKGRGSFFTYNHIDAIGTIKKMGYHNK